MTDRLCFRKRKRKHTDASLIKYKLLSSHCQDLSKLLIGCRATLWQKTFSLFPRECFHLKAARVRSCSRRQVAGPGWLVVPPLVHSVWAGLRLSALPVPLRLSTRERWQLLSGPSLLSSSFLELSSLLRSMSPTLQIYGSLSCEIVCP